MSQTLPRSHIGCGRMLVYRVSPLSPTKLMGHVAQGSGPACTSTAGNCSPLRPSEVLALFMPCPDSVTQAVIAAARGYLLQSRERKKLFVAHRHKLGDCADKEAEGTASEREDPGAPSSEHQHPRDQEEQRDWLGRLSSHGLPSGKQRECSGKAGPVSTEHSVDGEATAQQHKEIVDDFEEALAFGILSGKERVARRLALLEQEVIARMRQHEKDRALKVRQSGVCRPFAWVYENLTRVLCICQASRDG